MCPCVSAAVTLLLSTCRYFDLRLYEVLIKTAASLVEVTRKAEPACNNCNSVAAVGLSLTGIQQVSHPRIMKNAVIVHLLLFILCLLAQRETLCAFAGGPCAPHVSIRFTDPLKSTLLKIAAVHVSQRCAFLQRNGSAAAGALSDYGLVTSRASEFAWSTSTAEAGLLVRQYAPATARLFAQFRRLRGSLPPAELRGFTPLM